MAEGFVTNPSAGGESEPMELQPRAQDVAQPSADSMVLGVSGQKFSSGHSAEEYHADLSNRENAVEEFDQLRTGNALVAGPLGRIEAQLRQADWLFSPAPRVEPRMSIAGFREEHGMETDALLLDDLEQEATQFHASWLLGGPAQEYAMETSFLQQALHEMCLFMAHPASIFEVVWRRVDGHFGTKLVPQRLCWMHPRSVKAFKLAESGRLKGIVQQVQHGWDEREDVSYGGGQFREHRSYIPAEKLLIIARNREGTLPEGTPFIRHMYADADRARHAIKWSMVDAQNRAVGIPFVEIPKGVDGKVVNSAIAQARRMTYGNQHLAYVVAPEGIKVGFVDMSANTIDLDAIVRAQEDRMRHVTGTQFTALGGNNGTGAQALAKELRKELDVVVQGVAAAIIEDLHRGLIEIVHRVNYGTRLPSPRLKATGLISIDPADLAALVTAKVIPADRDIANIARRGLGLGPLTEEDDDLDLAQISELATGQVIAMTGEAMDAVHAKLGLPPLPPELRAKYDAQPANTRGAAPAGPPAPAAAEAPEPLAFAAGGKPTPSNVQRARVRELKAMRRELVETIVERLAELRAEAVYSIAKKATTSSAGARLGGRLVADKATRSAFRRALREVADELLDHGRRSMRDDGARLARAKGVKVDLAGAPSALPAGGGLPPKIVAKLDLVTELNADAILDAIEPALRRAYYHARTSGSFDAEAALEMATSEVAGGGVTALKSAAQEVAGTAMNAGRRVGLNDLQEILGDAGLDLSHVTRVHEGNHLGPGCPCEPCIELDGKRISVDSPDYDTYEPPNFCLGWERCHCVYVLDEVSE